MNLGELPSLGDQPKLGELPSLGDQAKMPAEVQLARASIMKTSLSAPTKMDDNGEGETTDADSEHNTGREPRTVNREDESGDEEGDPAKAQTNLAEYPWMAPRVIMKWIDARWR